MPLPPLTCLESLVGLAPAALACFPLPTGVDTDWITASSRSKSAAGGVYLTSLAGLNFQAGQGGGSNTDIYDRLAKARSQAALYVRQAITQAPKYGYGQKRYAAAGTLGKAGNGSAYPGGAVLTLATGYQEAGGYLVTGLSLQATATVADVPVLLDGQPVGVLASTNAAPQVLQPPFLLPIDGHPHTLSAALPTGVLPLTGQLYCTTGCNGNSPFAQSVARNLPLVTSAVNNAGFVLQVQEVCVSAAADPLCYAATADDTLADALAQAVVGMAAYYWLMDLFMTAGYNRYTLLEQKQLKPLADNFKAAADANILWLAQPNGLARLSNPCYTCLPNPYGPRITNVY